jgi:CRISPR system Cascade subunit CasD
MQSWGTRSRFSHRDTETEPSKSGVLGLVAAALGRPRGAALDDLAALRMAVRVDAAGHIESDYQTALKVAKADGSTPDTVLSWRQYLADARFLVGLEGDEGVCRQIDAALRAPRWPLFLGRKGFVPGEPVATGVEAGDAVTALRRTRWPVVDGDTVPELWCVRDAALDEDGDVRLDVPISFTIDDRRYATRRVVRELITPLAVTDGHPTTEALPT